MKLLKYITLALVAGLLLYGTGAAADDIFEKAFQVTSSVFKNVRYIVYIIGGFGLIGLSVAAMMGKMQFKWLVYVCLGLALVAAADMIVQFATQDAIRSNYTPTITYDRVDAALGEGSASKNGSNENKSTVKDAERRGSTYRTTAGETQDPDSGYGKIGD